MRLQLCILFLQIMILAITGLITRPKRDILSSLLGSGNEQSLQGTGTNDPLGSLLKTVVSTFTGSALNSDSGQNTAINPNPNYGQTGMNGGGGFGQQSNSGDNFGVGPTEYQGGTNNGEFNNPGINPNFGPNSNFNGPSNVGNFGASSGHYGGFATNPNVDAPNGFNGNQNFEQPHPEQSFGRPNQNFGSAAGPEFGNPVGPYPQGVNYPYSPYRRWRHRGFYGPWGGYSGGRYHHQHGGWW